jgi:hypothetical protein
MTRIQGSVNEFIRRTLNGARGEQSCIIDEDVDPTKGVYGFLYHIIDLFPVRNVTDEGQTLATDPFDRLPCLFKEIGKYVTYNNPRAFRGQIQRHLLAHALRRTRYDSDFINKPFRESCIQC